MSRKDPLESYFSKLALDLDIDNLTVVVDNARIPLHFDGASNNSSNDGAFSSSMSALDTVLFPPPFLNEYDRWSSMEGSGGGSDFSLGVPSRSQDDNSKNSLNELIDCMIEDEQRIRRRNISPHASMDSTERMLRELPGPEASKNISTIRNNPSKGRGTRRRQRNRDDTIPMSPMRTKDEDLPSLKNCPYNEQIESHPTVGVRRLPQSVAIGLSNLLNDDSYKFATLLDEEPNVEDGEGDAIPVVDHGTKLASPHIQKDGSRDENRSPCFVDPISSRISSMDEEIGLKRRDLSATRSPQALSDFPYYSQIIHHTKKKIPLELNPPVSSTRKSEQFTSRSHPRKSPPRLIGHSALPAVVEI